MATQEAAVVRKSRLTRFFREVKAELKKVTWPTKKEIISYTIIVFISVLLVALLIWVIDSILVAGYTHFIH